MQAYQGAREAYAESCLQKLSYSWLEWLDVSANYDYLQ